MKIYADVFFTVNLFIDYFLLLAVKKFFNLKVKGIRLFLGALLGGAVSLLCFIPINDTLLLIITLLSSLILCRISFGFGGIKRLILYSFTFTVFSLIFSGLNLFLINAFNIKALVISGNVYYDIDLFALVIFTFIFYIVFILCEKLKKHKSEEKLFHKVTVIYMEKSFEITMKIDTGNTLKEPFSGDPVIICDKRKIETDINKKHLRLIPYTVVNSSGILYAFKPDEILIDGNKLNKNIYIALSEEKFGSEFYSGLLPANLL